MADKTVKKPGFFAKLKERFARLGKYFRDTKSEMKKVVWPTKKQSLHNTLLVIVVVIVAAIVLVLLDMIFGGAARLLIGA